MIIRLNRSHFIRARLDRRSSHLRQVRLATRAGGATTYCGEHASRVYGCAFADPFVDGPYTSCTLDLRETWMVRVKACNGCGCSDWSETIVVDPASCD